MIDNLDIKDIRSQFPALHYNANKASQVPIFFDGPGGTQLPMRAIQAIQEYFEVGNSNLLNSSFYSVEHTHKIVDKSRKYAMDFVGANKEHCIVFGANMTSITAYMSRLIAENWNEGDEIIVSDLDHYANVSFWQGMAKAKGVTCHHIKIHKESCSLNYEHLESLVTQKTKLIAISLASNVSGSTTDPKKIVKLAKSVGAQTYLDSVHLAPHFLPNMSEWNPDFLVCSAYKFFGPHLGFICAKHKALSKLRAFKVEPANNKAPDAFETGTKSFEALSGFIGAIEYLISLKTKNFNSEKSTIQNIRELLELSYDWIGQYEEGLSEYFLKNIKDLPAYRLCGVSYEDFKSNPKARCSTFSFLHDTKQPQEISEYLAKHNILAGASNFYAKGIMQALDIKDILRVGFVHYNTYQEIDILLDRLSSFK